MFYGINKIDGSWGFHPEVETFISAVEITDDEHRSLLAGQQTGQQIQPNEQNYPILVTLPDPEPSYQELRAAKYPDYRDFLDAQVKINSGDPELVAVGETQQQAYIQACLEVKVKYPKSAI